MSAKNVEKKLQIKRHRPTDTLDPGFTIDGMKLRWISSRREEDHFGRIWLPLRREQLEDETVKAMEREAYGIWSGGSTIRRGDLVLAYAPIKEVEELRAEKAELAQEMLNRVDRNKTPMKGTRVFESETRSVGRSSFDN